jgi:hypothetical protein
VNAPVGPVPTTHASAVAAATTPDALHWVVTLGDSYISGQGARWAGNASRAQFRVDALGPGAYLDGRSSRGGVPGCRRATQSVADLSGSGIRGRNLACSGARTFSAGTGRDFTPGVDTYSDGHGHVGQVRTLRRFAASHDVSDVVVLVGGNDFGFGAVLRQCVDAFLAAVQAHPRPCSQDPAVTRAISADRVAAVGAAIAASLRSIAAALTRGGHAAGTYRILALTYPAPLPPADALRYPQTLHARYLQGGCPFLNADATWAATTAVTAINDAVELGVRRSGVPNAGVLDLSEAFDGHRLCERGVGRLEETGLSSWRAPGAADRLEWVNGLTVAPGRLADSVHPNYWGMLAMRACVGLALQQPRHSGSHCVPVGDSADASSPRMALR